MFADNRRISSLQMERQFLLTYLGPILLMGSGFFQGRNGILGILAGAFLICVWNFFLHRHTGFYRNPDKYWGKFMGKLLWIFYECYLLLIGGWLLYQMGEAASVYFLTGIPNEWIFILLAAAALGGCQTIQARGRLAQVSWPLISSVFAILLLLAAFQEKDFSYISDSSNGWTMQDMEEIINSAVLFVSNMLGIVLLPFLHVKTDGQGESTKVSFGMIGKITLWIVGITVLLTVSFGENGSTYVAYPLLDLMAGIHLPGGFLRRLDLIFLTFLFFVLVFSLGSIFFYSGYLGERFGISWGRVPAAVGSVLLACYFHKHQVENTEYAAVILCIFLPVFLVLTCCHGILRKRVAFLFLLCFCLTGCQVVEPEKRAYPLAIGLDYDTQEEQYQMYLGMVSLAESTGQGKSGDESNQGEQGFLLFEGVNQQEIMEYYDNTQELYLDVGHVQAVIFGENLLQNEEKAREFLLELEQEQTLGNGAYVFQTSVMQEVFAKNGQDTNSLGQYLSGIYENRIEQGEKVNLGQIYRQLHNENTWEPLPTIQIVNQQLYVEKTSE